MFNKKLGIFVVIMFLLAGNIFWALDYIVAQKQLKDLRAQITTQNKNNKPLLFLQAFVEQVIKSDKEVSFETRLKLENDVREIGDEKILAQWQTFINSKNETEVQNNVKELLNLLVVKAIDGQIKIVETVK